MPKEQAPKPVKKEEKIIPVGLDFGFWDEDTWLDAVDRQSKDENWVIRPVKYLEEPKDGKKE